MMLATFDQLKNHYNIDGFLDSVLDRNLTYYASDLLDKHACQNHEELSLALKRACDVCSCIHLPLRENIKAVYREQHGQMVQDWRLSPMAYMLLLLNSDASNQVVAQVQVELIKRALNQE